MLKGYIYIYKKLYVVIKVLNIDFDKVWFYLILYIEIYISVICC